MKKNQIKLIGLILAVSMLFAFSGAAFAQSDPTAWYGNGKATQYYIGTAEELAYLANLVNGRTDYFAGKTITLTSDIDLAGIDTELSKYSMYLSASRPAIPYDGNGWVPIGAVSARSFQGIFDGDGYVVKNLFINRPEETNQGLFGFAQTGSTIKNIGVIDVDVTGFNYVGGLVGRNNAIIENCFTTGNVRAVNNGNNCPECVPNGEYIGGISGNVSISIRNTYSTADVTGWAVAGGIAGIFDGNSTTAEYIYATGTVTSTFPDQYVGTGGMSGGISGAISRASGTVQNVVALNDTLFSVNKLNPSYHPRIADKRDATIFNAYAWEGMTLNGEIIPGGMKDSSNGENVSAEDIYTGKVFGPGYADFPTDVWIIEPGKLPILRVFEERNLTRGGVSLQSTSLPTYIEPVELNGLGVIYNDNAVVVKNAERLAVATLWFSVVSGRPQFEGLNNFTVLDSTLVGGQHRVTLGYMVAGGQGFTSANAGLVKITGATGLNLLKARFSGYDENGKAGDFTYIVEKNTSGGVIIPPDPPIVDPVNYDLNNDGAVDQLDLAIALSFFTVNGGDANWNSAKIADFNKDGIIDIEDFILLLNHMTF